MLAALARDRLLTDVAAVRSEDWRFVAPTRQSRVQLGPEREWGKCGAPAGMVGPHRELR